MYLYQDNVTKVVTKYVDQLILVSRGFVGGISSCSLKIVSQVCVNCQLRFWKWVRLRSCHGLIEHLELSNLCQSWWPQRAIFWRPHKTIVSTIERSISLFFWMVSFNSCLSWTAILSHTPLIHSTKASQAATAALWYAASPNTPLASQVFVLLAKNMQGRQYSPEPLPPSPKQPRIEPEVSVVSIDVANLAREELLWQRVKSTTSTATTSLPILITSSHMKAAVAFYIGTW